MKATKVIGLVVSIGAVVLLFAGAVGAFYRYAFPAIRKWQHANGGRRYESED